ncbi:uncharacterized protein LOC132759605 [Ruditapes philippinarum]|uniref:uncharacterized protein LOC132759605 n=1 Tax=Ruditapes philippinarum TaxID=129788 RepID=UPI00295BE089|nr:uncharacterized protein LOC132759605 [Ruditapes philippinarum]
MSDRRKREREENEQAGFIERHDADQETISRFDHPTVEIKLHCKAMFEAADAVHKYGEKVHEEQMKAKSKHLEKYETKYTDYLEALKTEMSFIDSVSITRIRDLNILNYLK